MKAQGKPPQGAAPPSARPRGKAPFPSSLDQSPGNQRKGGSAPHFFHNDTRPHTIAAEVREYISTFWEYPKFAYIFRTKNLQVVRNRATYFGRDRRHFGLENRDPEAHRKRCPKRGLDTARFPRSWRARRRGQGVTATDPSGKSAAGRPGALRQAVAQQSDTEKQSSRPTRGDRGHRSARPDPRACRWYDRGQ